MGEELQFEGEPLFTEVGALSAKLICFFCFFFHSSLRVELMDAVRGALKWRAVIETSVFAAVMQERFRDADRPDSSKLRNYLAPVRAVIA